MRCRLCLIAAVGLILGGCGQEEPPPPPAPTPQNPPTPVPVPTTPTPVGQTPTTPVVPTTPAPGTMNITVTANSTPVGATVTGGGRVLGTTPLTQVVPIPTPAAGQPAQTFDFLFALPGHQSTAITAAPQNGQIAITAALAPIAAVPTPPDTPQMEAGGDGRTLTVNGRGGGPIRDQSSVSASANVGQSCIIQQLNVVIRGNHSYNGDLQISLRSPSGDSYTLHNGGQNNPFRSHRVRRAAGKQAQGQWRLTVRDTLDQDFGQLNGFVMRLRCR